MSALNPKPFLDTLVGQKIIVRLKWGMEYKGILMSVDQYMNFHMANTEEWIDTKCRGNLGETLIRCNNVLYVRAAPVEQKQEEEEGMEVERMEVERTEE